MKQWHLLEQIFTVETIMTPKHDFISWNGIEPPEDIWQEAEKNKVDIVPIINENSKDIEYIVRSGHSKQIPLSRDWTVTRDTSIPNIIQIFDHAKKECLFILGGQSIIGLVTPADLNRPPAKTYFYNLIANLETELASIIKEKYSDDETLLSLIKKPDRQQEIREVLIKSKLELRVIHTLTLPEILKIIKDDDDLRKTLGFTTKTSFKNHISDLQTQFRNPTMHAVNLLLNNNIGIDKLNDRMQRVLDLLMQIEKLNNKNG